MSESTNADRSVSITRTSLPSESEARDLAHRLVAGNLAACVIIQGPIRSIYRWEGTIQEDVEWIVEVKSRSGLRSNIDRAILEKHPYEVPMILHLDVAAAHRPYVDWLQGATIAGN